MRNEGTDQTPVRTIHARVDDNAIERVTRFFNARLGSILGELFQNARRAGATEIDVRTTMTGIEVSDNGHGIAEPSVVLAFGRSEWDGLDQEDPAGMGCYSLARHTATITSRTADQPKAWRATLKPCHYRGEKSATVLMVEEETAVGTRVAVQSDEPHPDELAQTAARFLPVPVRINGKPARQIPFLEQWDIAGVDHHNDVSFAVRTGMHRGTPCLRVNFHGHIVDDNTRVPNVVAIAKDWYAEVDVHACPGLELVLPARREVVQNPFLKTLLDRMRTAIYREMAAQSPPIAVPYWTWEEAQEAGIPLPVSPARLSYWRAAPADWTGTWTEPEPQAIGPVPADAIIVSAELGHGAQAMLQHAVGETGIADRLVGEDKRYKGFPWYDELPRLTSIAVEIQENGTVTSLDSGPNESRQVDAIWLVATVEQPDQKESSWRIGTDAAIGSMEPTNVDTAGIVLQRGFQSDIVDIEDMVERGLFEPNEDYDESTTTQNSEFRKDLQIEMAKALGGAEAATEKALRQALNSTTIQIPSGRQAKLTISESGRVKIAFEAAA